MCWTKKALLVMSTGGRFKNVLLSSADDGYLIRIDRFSEISGHSSFKFNSLLTKKLDTIRQDILN